MEPEIISEQLGTQELLLQIIEKSDGVAILFTIIILIGIISAGIPIIKILQSYKKNQIAIDLEGRKIILDIVQQNTEALQSLKNTHNMSIVSTNLHLQNIEKSSASISEKISALLTALNVMENSFNKTANMISDMKEKTDVHINNVLDHQRLISIKLEKIDDILVGDMNILKERMISFEKSTKTILEKISDTQSNIENDNTNKN